MKQFSRHNDWQTVLGSESFIGCAIQLDYKNPIGAGSSKQDLTMG